MILILVMAEEKWEEADFLRQQIESCGHKARILDMGLLGEAQGSCEITREEVILASGRSPEEVAHMIEGRECQPWWMEAGKKCRNYTLKVNYLG